MSEHTTSTGFLSISCTFKILAHIVSPCPDDPQSLSWGLTAYKTKDSCRSTSDKIGYGRRQTVNGPLLPIDAADHRQSTLKRSKCSQLTGGVKKYCQLTSGQPVTIPHLIATQPVTSLLGMIRKGTCNVCELLYLRQQVYDHWL